MKIYIELERNTHLWFFFFPFVVWISHCSFRIISLWLIILLLYYFHSYIIFPFTFFHFSFLSLVSDHTLYWGIFLFWEKDWDCCALICLKDSRTFLGLISETKKKKAISFKALFSVLPMPDTRQTQKNAVPNQSDGNIEGDICFSIPFWEF